jgi:hypothetical protein
MARSLQKVVLEASFADGTTDPTETSAVVELAQADFASLQLTANVGSGNVQGAWLVEVSNDYKLGSNNEAGRWTDLTSISGAPSIPAVTGSTSNIGLRLGLFEFLFVRVSFNPSAGAGAVKAVIAGKRIGV